MSVVHVPYEITSVKESKELEKGHIFHCHCPSIKEPVFLVRRYKGRHMVYTLVSTANLYNRIKEYEAVMTTFESIYPLPVEWGFIKNLIPTTLGEMALYTSSNIKELEDTLNFNDSRPGDILPRIMGKKRKLHYREYLGDTDMLLGKYQLTLHGVVYGTAEYKEDKYLYCKIDKEFKRFKNDRPINPWISRDDLKYIGQ